MRCACRVYGGIVKGYVGEGGVWVGVGCACGVCRVIVKGCGCVWLVGSL